jgi:hypothetical protein
MFTYSLLFYLECRPLLKLLPLFLRLPYPIYRVLWSKIFSSQCNLPQAREITEKCLLEFNVVMIYDAEVWHSIPLVRLYVCKAAQTPAKPAGGCAKVHQFFTAR